MNQESGEIKSFTEENKLVLIIYQIIKLFPKEEMFGLVNQMKGNRGQE